MKSLLAAAAAALLLLPTGAAAQSDWPTQARETLRAGASALPRGYEITHQIQTGSLDAGGVRTVSFNLTRGVRYAIIGVCDTDCTDLDMVVSSPHRHEVARDEEQDDTPVALFTARSTGQYRVRVTMAACEAEPCGFGVGVYGKR